MRKKLLLIFVFLIPTFSYSQEIVFSEKAWSDIKEIYKKILNHPFNRELKKGTLDKDKFYFYKNQDAYFLKKFSKALAMLASKLDDISDIRMVLKFASDSFDENLSESEASLKNISPSNFTYTEFLLSTSFRASKGELAAAILPCYWIYLEVAKSMKQSASSDNPFTSWINLYSSKLFEKSVESMIKLSNRLYKEASTHEKKKMLLAFKIASKLELDFWDDSYHKRGLLFD